MLDAVAAKTGSRGEAFDTFLTMTVCALAGGTMLLSMAKLKPYGLFIGQDADLRCVKITAINLALHNLYGYAIWGNSLSNERKLIYATGFDGKGVIRKLANEEMQLVPAIEP